MNDMDQRPIHFQVTEGVPYSACGLAGAQIRYSRNIREITCDECLQLAPQEAFE